MKHRLALQGLCKRGKASDGDADTFACESPYQNFRKVMCNRVAHGTTTIKDERNSGFDRLRR